ncbi:HlyD family type I secretion periplasmic adaptor subunit [Shewanella sp. OPT22]|nr:HlyD family type I secretion periplasmic adaptor subunit [Shewanella sp. OPT22]
MFETLKRYSAIWKSAKTHYEKQGEHDRKGDELEFLPAAVEILETPASPVGRSVAIIIMSLFVILVIWAWFGKIDIEATAQGKIVPVGQVKAVQALEIGKIDAIYVTEGQHVSKGDKLIKLNPTESEVNVQQVQHDMQNAQLNVFRLNLLLHSLDSPNAQVSFTQSISEQQPELWNKTASKQIQLQSQLFNRDFELFKSLKSSLASALLQQKATIESVKTNIEKLKTLEPLFTEQEKVTKKLRDKGHVSYVDWLAYKEKQVETSQTLKVQKSRLIEAKSQLASIISNGVHQDRMFRSQRLKQLEEQTLKSESYALTLRKVKQRERNQYLTAPVAGTVQQVQVHTIGGVVQPAQPLMVIVPDSVNLEIEAYALNKDIGFLKPNMKAEIKVESFPYTRYGLISGELVQTSRDAIEQQNVGRVYKIKVKMNQKSILVGDKQIPLQPGMSVTVEVKTGKRRLLEFFLAPFLRYQNEAMRER